MPLTLKWIGCAKGNYRPGRVNNNRPRVLVLHLMDGSLAGTDAWFLTAPDKRPASLQAPSSAHYGIGKDGTIHQYVAEQDTAFHAGRVLNPKIPIEVNPNYWSIGVEHEGRVSDIWPEAMVDASVTLLTDICQRIKIPADRAHIIGHREIFSEKPCPGPHCPIDEIVRRVAERLAS